MLEAIDEQGRSLFGPSKGETILHESGYLGVNPSPLVHLRLDLVYPDPPAIRLKKVRGLIPLIVSTRKSDPLEILLSGDAARTSQSGRVTITVSEVHRGQADQAGTIDLAIKVAGQSTTDLPAGESAENMVQALASPQQLEVLDAAGRMIPWFPSSSFFNGEEAKITLTLLDHGAAPVIPALIRYHSVIRDRTEVPFEFRDLPMP